MKFILKGKPKKGEVKLVLLQDQHGVTVEAISPDGSMALILFCEDTGYYHRISGGGMSSTFLGFNLDTYGRIKELEGDV
jgi:hypothetical protein